MTEICYPDSTDWGCIPPETLAELDPDVQARSEALAWSTLVALTGYYFTACPITVRPCRKACSSDWDRWAAPPMGGNGSFYPHIGTQGYWVNSCMCGADACSCTVIREIVLPGPVGGPVVVEIDGAPLDPTAYRVDNGNRLVRQDGGEWPLCQDMNLPAGDVGTWTVTYYRGTGPNTLLNYAAGVLAWEYYLACTGQDCRLPDGVTQITRQGIQMTMASGPFSNGLSGIREVDAVVGLYNPNGLQAPPYISSPDRKTARTTTYGG
jgi:hypothetical protein